MRIVLLSLTVATALASPSQAAIIRVPGNFDFIQDAIQAASDTDTVLVAPGIYQENISFLGKAILVGSWFVTTGDPAYLDSTVIEPGGVADTPIVTFAHGEGPGSVICGFTIRNGMASDGGGIYCHETSPTICHNSIVNNVATNGGAGIFALYGGPTILSSTIEGNQATGSSGDGGGIYAQFSAPVIRNNHILWNFAGYRGAGIFCEHSEPTITDNVIHDNTCADYYGGGIASRNCGSVITGNVIYGNDGGGYGGGLFY